MLNFVKYIPLPPATFYYVHTINTANFAPLFYYQIQRFANSDRILFFNIAHYTFPVMLVNIFRMCNLLVKLYFERFYEHKGKCRRHIGNLCTAGNV